MLYELHRSAEINFSYKNRNIFRSKHSSNKGNETVDSSAKETKDCQILIGNGRFIDMRPKVRNYILDKL